MVSSLRTERTSFEVDVFLPGLEPGGLVAMEGHITSLVAPGSVPGPLPGFTGHFVRVPWNPWPYLRRARQLVWVVTFKV